MAVNEKEYNGYLFDQLTLAEDILEIAQTEDAPKTAALIEKKIAQIKRKLYQSPPLVERE